MTSKGRTSILLGALSCLLVIWAVNTVVHVRLRSKALTKEEIRDSEAAPPPVSPVDAPAIEEFIRTYVRLINARDTNAYIQLIHPDCLACWTEKTEPFYRNWLRGEFEYHIPTNFEVRASAITNWNGGGGLATIFDFPVRPTHFFSIGFASHNVSTGRGRYLVCSSNSVLLIVGCPKPGLVEECRKKNETNPSTSR